MNKGEKAYGNQGKDRTNRQELLSDKNLMAKFEKNPAKVIGEVLEVQLPEELVNQVVEGVKARINLDKVGDALGSLSGLFGRK